MDKYLIVLTNEKAAAYKFVTFIVAFINALVFGYIYVKSTGFNFKSLAMTGFFINAAVVIFFLFLRVSSYKFFLKTEVSFMVSALLWLVMGKYAVAVFLLLFAILGIYTNKKPVILFSAKGIRYPSFPPKLILWNEVEQVLLKDDIVTIDLKNNKLIQVNVDKESAAIDEKGFNEFCNKQLK